MLHFLTLIVVVFAAVIAYLNSIRGEVELVPFFLCKLTLLVLPEKFPSNSTVSATIFRKFLGISSLTTGSRFNVSSLDAYISEPDSNGGRLVRVFNSGMITEKGTGRDVLIFYFAGAWMLGSVGDNDRLCRRLARLTGFVVVCAEYRLAPEHTFPTAFDDALAALHWTKNNIGQYGGNPQRIYVMGESAGGNLAAAVAAYNADSSVTPSNEHVEIIGLLLVYPPTAANFTTRSYLDYAIYNGMLTKMEMEHAWNMYSGGVTIPPSDYRYQPMHTPEPILQYFPPTLFIVAEYDVLRDDSLHLAQRLRQVNVPVDVQIYPTIHGFFGREVSTYGLPVVEEACKRLIELSNNPLLQE